MAIFHSSVFYFSVSAVHPNVPFIAYVTTSMQLHRFFIGTSFFSCVHYKVSGHWLMYQGIAMFPQLSKEEGKSQAELCQ